jgi:prevent-host-death family protein
MAMYVARRQSMANRYSIAEARNQLARIVHDAEKGHPVELTRRGKPVAVLVSAREYARLHAGKESFWEAICRFRREHNLEELDIRPEEFPGPRDRSVGRKVEL